MIALQCDNCNVELEMSVWYANGRIRRARMCIRYKLKHSGSPRDDPVSECDPPLATSVAALRNVLLSLHRATPKKSSTKLDRKVYFGSGEFLETESLCC